MTEKRNNRAYGESYIGDNLARKQAVAPALPKQPERIAEPKRASEPERIEPERVRRAGKAERRERGLAASFGFAFTLIMAVAMAVIFITLVKYISLNIELSRKARTITELRKELTVSTMENDNMEMSINSSIDYDYIYKVATEELGMVYASQNQIMTYDHKDSEYVVQYKDVE